MKNILVALILLFTVDLYAQQSEFYMTDSSYLYRGDYSAQWLLQIKDSSHIDGTPHFSPGSEDYVKIWADNFWIRKSAVQYRISNPVSLLSADSSGWIRPVSAGYFLKTSDTANRWQSKGSYVYASQFTWTNLSGKPTTVSSFTNDAGYVTSSSLTTTLSGYITSSGLTSTLSSYATTSALTTGLAAKQNTITLTTTGTSGAATLVGSTLNIPNYSFSSPTSTSSDVQATGTTYNLTTTSAKVDFGTTDPTITLPSAGTYLIVTNVKLSYASLTTLGTSTSTLKVRRTNNTATDLASTTFDTPVVTLLTGTAGDCDIRSFIYTTSTSGDVLEIWGNRGANISVGNVVVSEASIAYIKLSN